MNKNRRKRIQEIIDKIVDAADNLDVIKDEEQEVFDNMPENFQCAERGEAIQECVDDLDDAVSGLQDVIETLENIVNR